MRDATRLGRSEAMNLAATVLALSNALGIEGMIDAEASPPRPSRKPGRRKP
jgi:hypothetical protein